MATTKVRKVLVKVIIFTYTVEKLRVTLYNFCARHYRVKDENLRTPNAEFMMVWKQNSWELIGIERLNDIKLISIKNIIERYERSLNYLYIKENQEIEDKYLDDTK